MKGALHARLHAVAAQAVDAARHRGRRQWAALRRAALPGEGPFALDREAERFFWERPEEGRRLVGAGCAETLTFEGSERFDQAAAAARRLFDDLHLAGDEAPASAGPLLVGGFAFDSASSTDPVWQGFPAARLLLPARLFATTPEGSWLTVVCSVEVGESEETLRRRLTEELARCEREETEGGSLQHADFRLFAPRGPMDYEERVDRALEAIAAGEIEKVVVARCVDVQRSQGWKVTPLLKALRFAYPDCTSFALGQGDADFLGASPEPLVELSQGQLKTAALAGSAPRGHSPEEDARLGRELLESKKDQAEHAVVVRALRERLSDCCETLEIPEAPRLRGLAGIQHLETPIHGRLQRELHVLELAGRLHPSPAVAGFPRARALEWLREHEGLERGWYAGALGVVDAQGDGEFCTALRSALLRGGEARLFAGAGIVERSEPRAELRETRLKLRALLDPLLEL